MDHRTQCVVARGCIDHGRIKHVSRRPRGSRIKWNCHARVHARLLQVHRFEHNASPSIFSGAAAAVANVVHVVARTGSNGAAGRVGNGAGREPVELSCAVTYEDGDKELRVAVSGGVLHVGDVGDDKWQRNDRLGGAKDVWNGGGGAVIVELEVAEGGGAHLFVLVQRVVAATGCEDEDDGGNEGARDAAAYRSSSHREVPCRADASARARRRRRGWTHAEAKNL